MRSRLVLIRHCQSQVDPDAAPATWGLTEAGQSQAQALAAALARDDLVAVGCGGEPKMVETAGPLAQAVALPVEESPAFGETHSEGWLELDDFNEVVAALFANPSAAPAPGWEPARDAAERFLTGFEELSARHADGTIAICSGGRVLTAVLDQLGLVASGAAFDTWRQIRMPDMAVVAFEAGDKPVVLRHFGLDEEFSS